MKILFIVDNFPPEVSAPATRTLAHCRRWVEAGEEVTVITSNPNFPTGRVFEGHKNRLYQRSTIDGVNVVRVWTFITPNEGFITRILDFFSYAIASFFAGLFERADVIVASSPHLFLGLSARALAFLKRKPWVFEVRDIWPESIVAVGMMRKGLVYRALEAMELHFYRSAAAVIILSEGFRENLTRRGIPSAKIFAVPNGADLSDLVPGAPDPALKARLSVNGKFVVGFIGTLGAAHGLDFVLDCAPLLAAENVHLLLIGAGAKKAELAERVKREALANVTVLDQIPKSEVPRYMAVCDAALVNLRASETFLSVIPSKIFEAAFLETPMLIGVDGVAREIVEKFHAGLFYPPENAQAFVEAVRRLRSDAALYRDLQAGCRKLAQAYDRSALAAQALDVIRRSAARR